MIRKIKNAADIGYMYYSCLPAPLIIKFPSAPTNLLSYTYNSLSESNKKATLDTRYFDLLVQDAIVVLKHGKEYFCYSVDQITAIRVLMPEYQIEVLNDDGIYRLYAHRGN